MSIETMQMTSHALDQCKIGGDVERAAVYATLALAASIRDGLSDIATALEAIDEAIEGTTR